MDALSRSMRTYALAYFTILACILGWALYIAAWLGADIDAPSNLPIAPAIAALLVAAGMGRAELGEWGRRLARVRASLGWYVLAVVAPIVVAVAAVLANSAFGAPLPTPAQLAGVTELWATFLFLVIFIGLGEEGGWTAFAAPSLLNRRTFIAAWLILSGIRVVWHLPLMLTGDLPWVLGVGGNLGFQFLLLWIFLRSGGVWFLAAIWHAVLNTVGGEFFFQMVEGADRARLGFLLSAGYLLLAAAVFVADRRRLSPTSDVQPAAR